ncbi:MAG: TIGR02646 family protein [Proteobacteria bacterium]|nr:MAG: TIGR02646 family protein [Pseudomonadota bacterium]
MKKINKSPAPNPLTEYEKNNPKADWDNGFRNEQCGNSYNDIKTIMLADQGGLCGYCEKKIQILPAHHQRVEHFHSKSDQSDPNKNWALDWDNVFLVCLGGIKEKENTAYQLPANLSCDAYKDHLIQKKRLPKACEGYYLNPLRIISKAGLFKFDKSTGKLVINKEQCENLTDIDNQYSSFEELVEKTIDILNLNCQRLCDDRLEVLKSYNQEVAKYRRIKDKQGLNKLARRWFNNKWPSFFTTRRDLLGSHAEHFLAQSSYNG